MPVPSLTPSVTDDQLFGSLGRWLQSILPAGVEVVQGFDNGVPAPRIDDPAAAQGFPLGFATMQTISDRNLSTSISTFEDLGPADPANSETLSSSVEWIVQVDFYGAAAADWSSTATRLFRTARGTAFFDNDLPGLAPLYAEDVKSAPLVDGEHQWQKRRVLMLHFNYNPSVTLAEEFADQLSAGIINVESTYPS